MYTLFVYIYIYFKVVVDNMNSNVFARDARRQKKSVARVSSSSTTPPVPSQEPKVEIIGTRNPGDIPVV